MLRFAISRILQSSNNGWGSDAVLNGLSGDPSGLYAVRGIPCLAQNSFSFVWFKYGWDST